MFKNTGVRSRVPSLAGFSQAFSPLFSSSLLFHYLCAGCTSSPHPRLALSFTCTITRFTSNMRAFTAVVVATLFASQALAAPGIPPRDVDARNEELSSRDEHGGDLVRRQPFLPHNVFHDLPFPIAISRRDGFPSGSQFSLDTFNHHPHAQPFGGVSPLPVRNAELFLGYGPAMSPRPLGRRFGPLGPGIAIRPDLFGPRPLLGRQFRPMGPGIAIPHFPPLGPYRAIGRREMSEGELKRALSDQVLANGPEQSGLSGIFHHIFSRDLADDL
ncbi:uncharacterized protein EI90DRAFT_1599433 [Cantharellus anzutake]|uniref:uncharacterized protein n=1 Tax=Cantharellus anzutake TaxID=1750568 RepID=UPI001908592C|nr:uncharacterized protein EI90DRAFT_1599433 [Cantharellus anzutake]KAF8328098.1 hypothetical protein EI90DRAFT_1599433 [Cantharellus anzutake]